MHDFLTVLPMAFVMVAGPQIVTAIMLAASQRPRRDSGFFLVGAAGATLLGVAVAYAVAGTLKHRTSSSAGDATDRAIDGAIVALLVALAWKVFRDRTRSEPPRWMAKLQTASPLFALRIGFLLFLLLPGDIVTMATVGAFVAHHGMPWWHCLPFVGLTVALAATPLILLLLLGRRVGRVLPKARAWMSSNSWIVSEVVIAFFLVMTLKDLLGP